MLGTVAVVSGAKGFEIALKKGFLGDTLLASLFPNVYKNMNEKRMSDVKYAEAMMGLDEKKVTIMDKKLDAEIKSFDLKTKESLANFYNKHPGVSDAKKYATAAKDIFNDIGDGIKAIISLFLGGK